MQDIVKTNIPYKKGGCRVTVLPVPCMYYEKVYSKIVFYYWTIVLSLNQMFCSFI